MIGVFETLTVTDADDIVRSRAKITEELYAQNSTLYRGLKRSFAKTEQNDYASSDVDLKDRLFAFAAEIEENVVSPELYDPDNEKSYNDHISVLRMAADVIDDFTAINGYERQEKQEFIDELSMTAPGFALTYKYL